MSEETTVDKPTPDEILVTAARDLLKISKDVYETNEGLSNLILQLSRDIMTHIHQKVEQKIKDIAAEIKDE